MFDGEHIPLATLPGHAGPHGHDLVGRQDVLVHRLEDRLGLCAGRLLTAVRTAKQFLTYVNGAPFQYAIATGLRLPDDRFVALASDLRARRDQLCAGLAAAGFTVFPPAGTYFVTTDIRSLGEDDGLAFCRACPNGAASSRSRTSSSTTTRTRDARWCASRSASVPRCSTRRSSAS